MFFRTLLALKTISVVMITGEENNKFHASFFIKEINYYSIHRIFIFEILDENPIRIYFLMEGKMHDL